MYLTIAPGWLVNEIGPKVRTPSGPSAGLSNIPDNQSFFVGGPSIGTGAAGRPVEDFDEIVDLVVSGKPPLVAPMSVGNLTGGMEAVGLNGAGVAAYQRGRKHRLLFFDQGQRAQIHWLHVLVVAAEDRAPGIPSLAGARLSVDFISDGRDGAGPSVGTLGTAGRPSTGSGLSQGSGSVRSWMAWVRSCSCATARL